MLILVWYRNSKCELVLRPMLSSLARACTTRTIRTNVKGNHTRRKHQRHGQQPRRQGIRVGQGPQEGHVRPHGTRVGRGARVGLVQVQEEARDDQVDQAAGRDLKDRKTFDTDKTTYANHRVPIKPVEIKRVKPKNYHTEMEVRLREPDDIGRGLEGDGGGALRYHQDEEHEGDRSAAPSGWASHSTS